MSLYYALLPMLCCFTLTSQIIDYSNKPYGFSIKLPIAQSIITNKPPLPDHGFEAKVSDSQMISVYADYNSTEEANTEDALLAWVLLVHKSSFKKFCGGPVTIGGLKGFRIIGIAKTEYGEKIIDYIKLERCIPGKSTDTKIRYYFTISTNVNEYSGASFLFYDLVESFKVNPIN